MRSRVVGSGTGTGPWVGSRAVRELVPPDSQLSARWHVHDYPGPFARWNYHPEYEVHLARSGPGRYIVGDSVGIFEAGQLVLVGPEVPHDWISDLDPGEVLEGRDVVFQFHGRWLDQCAELLPELRTLAPLWSRARSGIEFSGQTAAAGAAHLEQIGRTRGADRLGHVFSLFHLMASAPVGESRLVSQVWVPRVDDPHTQEVVAAALSYILENLTGVVRLPTAARIAGMSDSAFSRYFKRASGLTFTEMVGQLRLAQAAKLLVQTDQPVLTIAEAVGYTNLSNFNRRFLATFARTPSAYRRQERVLRTRGDRRDDGSSVGRVPG